MNRAALSSSFSNHSRNTSVLNPAIVHRMCSPTSKVKLSVVPESCLQDEEVSIKVNGLKQHQNVTLLASMKDTRGVRFISYAHYTADDNGEVDVGTMESLGGRYTGVFPMGLIGAFLPAPKEYKYTRFFKRDVENPNIVTVSVYANHLSDDELCSSEAEEPLSSVTHERHYMAPGVQRIPVRYGKVRGCLFLPPGDGPFPGVVDMFGGTGGLIEFRSAQLASRGFASLALAYFGYDDLPQNLEELNVEYFEEAVEFLLKHDKVLDQGVGVIGVSKGGDVALCMAAFIPSVRACVAINCFNAPYDCGFRVGEYLLPSFGAFTIDDFRMEDNGLLNMYHAAVDTRKHPESTIPVEKSQAAFLFLVGADDRDIKSEHYAQLARERLSEHGYTKVYEVSSYPGTGHLLEPPYSPHCYASSQQGLMTIIWGGTVKHHIAGQEKAWHKMREFLWHHLVVKTQVLHKSVDNELCDLKSKL